MPSVFITYAHDSAAHKETVARFARFLRDRMGISVVLDQWADGPRLDWSYWASDGMRAADFVVVVASPDYLRRSRDDIAPDDGAGAQAEIRTLHDMMTQNRREATRRILPVVLPGRSVSEIPPFLNPYSTTRFEIDSISDAGMAPLLAAIAPDLVPNADDGRPRWLEHSAGIRRASVRIEGRDYADSIVWRPAPDGEPTGFVEIDLAGRYQRLTAVAAVPDDAVPRYQVGHFRVHVDGVPHAEYRVAYGKPALVDVDVAGAARLRLETHRRTTGPTELAWGNPTLA